MLCKAERSIKNLSVPFWGFYLKVKFLKQNKNDDFSIDRAVTHTDTKAVVGFEELCSHSMLDH